MNSTEYNYRSFASEEDAIREYVMNVGRENRDMAWILSDRDTWHRNPFYVGPSVPHPEDSEYYCNDIEDY